MSAEAPKRKRAARRRTSHSSFEPDPGFSKNCVLCSSLRELRGFRIGSLHASSNAMHGITKRFVYVLRSASDPTRHYVGLTSNIERRLNWHNAGPSGHTMSGRPWSPVVTLEFTDEATARRFERYLKSGSGRAFAKRHFAPS
jgi:putative endonuclease